MSHYPVYQEIMGLNNIRKKKLLLPKLVILYLKDEVPPMQRINITQTVLSNPEIIYFFSLTLLMLLLEYGQQIRCWIQQ